MVSLFEWLGVGLCHQSTWRMMEDAWLCDRCTGLYLGGFLGVVFAGMFASRFQNWRTQLVLCLFLLVPMTVDKLILGLQSAIDVRAWRIATGFLGGSGSGLFLGARALEHVRWPRFLKAFRGRFHLIAVALFFLSWVTVLFGSFTMLNLTVFLGLLLLCASGTAWALELISSLARRYFNGFAHNSPRTFAFWLFGILVILELLVVAATPSEYKPHISWFWKTLSWLGIERWA